jgi:hypothetical protein
MWRSIDLSRTGTATRWSGAGPVTGDSVEWFLQGVDRPGNVGVTSNKATLESLAPPAATGSITAALSGPQTAGWYTGPVGVAISGAPDITYSLDGAAPVSGSSLTVSETGVHTLDFQGSDGSHGTVAVPIDVTAPTIAIGSGIFPAGTPPQVVCRDAGSGIAQCQTTPTTIDNTVGTHTVHVRAVDRVGNVTEADGTYTVDSFTGFFAPVNNLPVVNTVKAGSSVPVKFSLKMNLGLSIFKAGYPKSQVIGCSSGAPQDPVEQTLTAGSSSLAYDATADQYTYVWKTDKAWPAGSCRQLILRFTDGTEQRATFKFQ